MALIPLVKSLTATGVQEINLSSIADYLFTLNLRAEFNKTCGSGTNWLKVPPIQLDDEGDAQNDPFNKNDDTNPAYTSENNGTNNVLKIISDTTPLNYVLKYLKFPLKVFLDPNNPLNNVNSEMPEFTHPFVFSRLTQTVYIAVLHILYELHLENSLSHLD